jgi:hypothetical protein
MEEKMEKLREMVKKIEVKKRERIVGRENCWKRKSGNEAAMGRSSASGFDEKPLFSSLLFLSHLSKA